MQGAPPAQTPWAEAGDVSTSLPQLLLPTPRASSPCAWRADVGNKMTRLRRSLFKQAQGVGAG